jgi:hypothetical protein
MSGLVDTRPPVWQEDDAPEHEVWRAEYLAKDAYTDQTGLSHSGYIVHAQIILRETGRFNVYEAYSKKDYPTAGVIAVDEHGREFRYTPNLVDYWGGGSWKCQEDGSFWKRPPSKPLGYVYPDGSGPVERIL